MLKACPGSSVFTNALPVFRCPCCLLAGPLRPVAGFPALRLLRGLRPTTRSSVGDGPARTSGLEGRARATWGGSHVPCVPISQDGRPTLPRQPRRAYAAGLRRGLLTRRLGRLRSRPPRLGDGRALHPGPYPPGSGPVQRLRGFARWFLAYAFWPCLPDPHRLAVPTRPVVVGLLPALTGVPRVGLPPASSGCCDSLTVKSFHLHSVTQNFVAHQPVVVVHRVVDAVDVGQQRTRQRAQLQQLVPVGTRAGQP